MSGSVEKYSTLIKLYPYLVKKRKQQIAESVSNPLINTICECCLNLKKNNNNNKKKKSVLSRRYSKVIDFFISKRNKIGQKKRYLKQKGANFLAYLFKNIAPLVATLLL